MTLVVKCDDGCWRWRGAQTSKGYGGFQLGGRVQSAHRLAYEQFVGPIPEGLQIDHLCGERSCVNPRHLEAVTCRENLMRGNTRAAANAAKTHCHRGHPFDTENTYLHPRGQRVCRTCQREYMQTRRAAA